MRPLPREEICFGEFTLVFAIDVIFSSVLGECDAEAMSAFDLAAALSLARALSAAARAAWDTMVGLSLIVVPQVKLLLELIKTSAKSA